jgi:hypothetical protein
MTNQVPTFKIWANNTQYEQINYPERSIAVRVIALSHGLSEGVPNLEEYERCTTIGAH